jgi:hyaluronoglucosaminidase
MHLGPVVGRDPQLHTIADGYMVNPMRRQNRIGRLPLATAADYARDPGGYEPSASMARAIERRARTEEERSLLADLVGLYPGSIAAGQNQYFNPVRAAAMAGGADTRRRLRSRLAPAVDGFRTVFGDRFPAELATLEADLAWLDS